MSIRSINTDKHIKVSEDVFHNNIKYSVEKITRFKTEHWFLNFLDTVTFGLFGFTKTDVEALLEDTVQYLKDYNFNCGDTALLTVIGSVRDFENKKYGKKEYSLKYGDIISNNLDSLFEKYAAP